MRRQAGRVSAPVLATMGIVGVVLCAALAHWLLSRDEVVKEKTVPDTYAVGQTLTPPPASSPAAGADATYREIAWQDLLPKAWDPMAPFKGLRLQDMADDDPRAQAANPTERPAPPTSPTTEAAPTRGGLRRSRGRCR